MDELYYPFNGIDIISSKKKLKKKLMENSQDILKKRVAILGGSTSSEIKNVLEIFLLNEGIQAEFYESAYNQYYQEVMFDNQELVDFSPEIIYIFTTNRNISVYPKISDSSEDVMKILDAEYQRFCSMWNHIKDKYNCPVIQNNFEMPLYRLQGNRDCYDIHGASFFIHELNGKMYKFAQENEWFYICDLNYISADYGLRKWQNLKHWYMYKYSLSIDAIPELAYNVGRIIKSILGKNKKGLVLDLDNTLWGGVISEDGIEGIEVGTENAEAEAYLEFQKYLKQLLDIGVVLCINSKNDYQNAIAGLNHPDSVLKPEDFVEIYANWNNKDENYLRIAESVGLLPESLVFIDDNPVERDIVKAKVKDVIAPNIGMVEQYIQIIDRLGAFEITSLTNDDKNRNQMYAANRKRKEQEKSFFDYKDYLRSLNMRAEIKPFDPVYFGRIAQLSNKSNQYNLTTRRYTQEEIQKIAEDEAYLTLQGRMSDKYGDNGIVSLIIGKISGNVCCIDLWLMSCRVLKRELEYAMMDVLVDECRKRKIEEIKGVYIPTKKNEMVREHFGKMGFLLTEEDAEQTKWLFKVTKDYMKKNTVMEVL